MWNAKVQGTDTISSKGGLYTENYQSSYSCGAAGTVTATGATVGDLQGAGKVTATDATLGYIDGFSSSTVEKITRVGSNLLSGYDDRYYVDPASGLVSINSSYSESDNAVGNATLTKTTAGNLYGVATVKLTEGSVEGAEAYNSKYITSNVSSATASNAVTSDTRGTVGTFTATSAGVAGSILGYSTVTLDHTKVGGSVGGWNYEEYRYGSKNVSSSIKQTFDKDGATLLSQNFASASSYAPTVALTLRNGAFVAGNADGIKTLTLTAGTVIGGDVYMADYAMKHTETITRDKKTGLYEQKKQYTSSQGAIGAATITGTSGSMDQLCGNINGAAKVTATDAVIGGLFNYCIVQSDSATRKGTALSSYDSRRMVDPTEYTSTYGYAVNASGNATLTRTSAGRIVNFATVKMTGGEIDGALVDPYGSSLVTTLKGGVYTFSQTVSSGVQGTFTAADAWIGGNVDRFATVTLTNCFLTGIEGAIRGGSSTLTMSGSGATLDAAIADANANVTSTFAAAGTLTATNARMAGYVVSNCATVTLTDCYLDAVVVDGGNTAKTALTLAGTNTIYDDDLDYMIDGFAGVTVKSGITWVAGGLRGTAGDDTVTVSAKSELELKGDMLFGEGTDSLADNGTLRVCGDFDAANLEKLSGSGLLALNDAAAAALRASIDAGTTKLSGKLEIVAAGWESDDVLAVRTKKEELADNTAATALKFDGGDIAGWLSGVEDADAYKFADTEDWISFSNFEGSFFAVELADATRHDDLTVELWKGGAKLQDVAWDDMTDSFDIYGLAAGDYQLRLTTAADTSALSYSFGIPEFA